MMVAQGTKVQIRGRESAGFGEVISNGEQADGLEVRYLTSPISGKVVRVPEAALIHTVLPSQTRCFQKNGDMTRYGRVVACQSEVSPLRIYLVRFAGADTPEPVHEDQFSVRSYLADSDPVEILANLANETPFFFEYRFSLLREQLRQIKMCGGLPALISSKIEILDHQVEIAARVLSDPTIRYLLADEVGLGKTIETGIILRQLQIDDPQIRMAAAVPEALVLQWREELSCRFGLEDVQVFPHSELVDQKWRGNLDLLVIDEAHRVVASESSRSTRIYESARILAAEVRNLLLLSATPLLHRDADLLALLELLDPTNYSRSDLPAFQRRTANRVELGRALLALKSATIPALVRRSATSLATLLPEDSVVRDIADRIAEPGADITALKHALHLHVSETYRIYRRMLRTRRRWLKEVHQRFDRKLEEGVEYDLDEEPYLAVWNILDEWRTEIAGRVQADTLLRSACSIEYVRLVEAIAAEPDRIPALVQEVMSSTGASPTERILLNRLASDIPAEALISDRSSLLIEILRHRLRHDTQNSKYVVFCPSPGICRRLKRAANTVFPNQTIYVADSSLSRGETGELFAEFARDNEARLLLTDSVGEEGINLQFCRAAIFYDLPWSPMRLEQRAGRLDRIDHAPRIACVTICSCEDDALAPDEAWRSVISKGFGIFEASISDLQHLIDLELPRLREAAFIGGPEALVAECERLASAVKAERQAIEEQDVIDGMHSLMKGGSLASEIREADRVADDFGKALTQYLKFNLGLKERWNEDENSFIFRLPHNQDPIIPLDRLLPLASLFNAQFTVHRSVAIENFALELFRPGHPGVDGCRSLLTWDDRGRAFAMWRSLRGLKHPCIIFRFIVTISVKIEIEEDGLDASIETARGCLPRMVRGWFPEKALEVFLDENGTHPAPNLIEICLLPYNKASDVNLAKDRADYVRQAIGSNTWRDLCRNAATNALNAINTGTELSRAREHAQLQAKAYFAMVHARTGARYQSGIESQDEARAAAAREHKLEAKVIEMLSTPLVQIDAIGAYFLSEEPFWGKTS